MLNQSSVLDDTWSSISHINQFTMLQDKKKIFWGVSFFFKYSYKKQEQI